jgi:ankyrin repeat protein
MHTKDILQKIAENADDKTALRILATNKEMNKNIYYQAVFGNRYPDLIKYREENESLKHLYLRMLETIGLVEEEFKIVYKEGNPEKILLTTNNIDQGLVWASERGKLRLVKWSLKNRANIHSESDEALRFASANGQLEVVKYLVEKGANIHAESDEALRLASENGHLEVVKYLVEQGANIHANNDIALRYASSDGHLEVVKYLVEQGANIHAQDDWALRWATKYGYLEVVKYLVEQGANIHALDDYALMLILFMIKMGFLLKHMLG